MTAILRTGRPRPATVHPVVRDPAVVLVDPVVNGHPFKPICAESGYAVVGIYTLPRAKLDALAPGHQAGDALSLYGHDPVSLNEQLESAVCDVRAIVPTTEPATHVAAVLAEQWLVPGNSTAIARARRDKIAMRELASRRGLPVPRFDVAGPGRDRPRGPQHRPAGDRQAADRRRRPQRPSDHPRGAASRARRPGPSGPVRQPGRTVAGRGVRPGPGVRGEHLQLRRSA